MSQSSTGRVKLEIEKWSSDQNQHEIHFFSEDFGYYLFGLNPEIFRAEHVEMLKNHCIHWLEENRDKWEGHLRKHNTSVD